MSSKETKGKVTSRKKMNSVKQELFKWICKKHATNSFLDRHLLREKALELTKILEVNGFKCTDHWMNTFLKEHGFSTDLSDRTGPVFDNYRDWIDLMRSTIIKYKHNELFHVDELTMYSDILPARITADENDTDEGTCSLGNRITVLIGCNSSGTTKLPLLICGPYPSRITAKDHVYCHSEDGRIDDSLLKNWLTSVNDRISRSNRKILLFLQRDKAHALQDFPLSNVNLVYLPEDFPPHLRPLRRDVFHYVKMIFRRRYAERLGQCTVEWNLRDILESLIDAWEAIPREIIICRFQRTHFRTDDYFLQIDCDHWGDLQTGITFKRFVTFDDDLSDRKLSPKDSLHKYDLRENCSKIQVNEDDSYSTLKSGDEILFDSRNHGDHTSESVATNYPRIQKDKSWPKGDPAGGHSGHRKSRKRPHSDTLLPSEEESGNRRESEDRIIKNVFAWKGPEVGCSGSIARKQLKRQALQRHRTETSHATESLQPVMDKALTLTTSTKADYTEKLIDSIHAPEQKAQRDANCQTEFGDLNEEQNAEKVFLNPCESCPPSTSTDDFNSLSKMLLQNVFQEIVKSHSSKETCSNKLRELDVEKQTPSDEGTSGPPSDQPENFIFSKAARLNLELNGDDSSGSEPSEKKLKIDHNWSKQFETTFVFGPSNASEHATCSSQHQQDENIVDSCIHNMTPSVSPKE